MAHLIRISVNFARLLGSCFVRTDAYSATGVAQIIYQSERFYTGAVVPLVHALTIGRFRPPAPPSPRECRVNVKVCVEEPRNACGARRVWEMSRCRLALRCNILLLVIRRLKAIWSLL